jgi:hypothetical protein
LPELLTAAQNEGLGHDTPFIWCPLSTGMGDDHT